jgi:cobalamin-dependent methionine synthase I
VTYDVYRRVLASKQLAIGTDLRAAMRETIDECEADGWTVENDGVYGFFFCNRGGERIEIRMQPTDPSEPVPLNNTSARSSR